MFYLNFELSDHDMLWHVCLRQHVIGLHAVGLNLSLCLNGLRFSLFCDTIHVLYLVKFNEINKIRNKAQNLNKTCLKPCETHKLCTTIVSRSFLVRDRAGAKRLKAVSCGDIQFIVLFPFWMFHYFVVYYSNYAYSLYI